MVLCSHNLNGGLYASFNEKENTASDIPPRDSTIFPEFEKFRQHSCGASPNARNASSQLFWGRIWVQIVTSHKTPLLPAFSFVFQGNLRLGNTDTRFALSPFYATAVVL
jgi:hypothetical protein